MLKSCQKIIMISDPQIDFEIDNGKHESNILEKCFQNMKGDIITICGDITEKGLSEEWDRFYYLLTKYSNIKELIIAPGNMDNVCNDLGKEQYLNKYNLFSYKNIKNLYYSYKMENITIISISPEMDGNPSVSINQLTFIEENIKEASERNIPVIILNHYQLKDTINVDWKYAHLGEESMSIKKILYKYNVKVLFCSGHIHRGLIKDNNGSIAIVKNVTYLSVPSICKPDIEHYKADNEDKGTGYIIDIHKKTLQINGYDFLNNKYLDNFCWKTELN